MDIQAELAAQELSAGLAPFCLELIERVEAGEDPLKIAQEARERIFDQWDSIDTESAAQRLAWAQDAAFAAGLNSVDLELRDAEVAAAARKGKNKGGFVPKWSGQQPGCEANKQKNCKCGKRLRILSRNEGWAILRKGTKVRDREGKSVTFGRTTRKHLKHTPDSIKKRATEELSQVRQWQDKYQPEVRKKLEQNVKVSNDHLERPDFVLFAIDAVKKGKASLGYSAPDGKIRWVYKKDYTVGKRTFTMNVIAEESGKKRRTIITFFDK